MIEEINLNRTVGYRFGGGVCVDEEKFHEWLTDNGVLNIALNGHIDQNQYSDKIRILVEFIGEKLSTEELAQLWKLQVCCARARAYESKKTVKQRCVSEIVKLTADFLLFHCFPLSAVSGKVVSTRTSSLLRRCCWGVSYYHRSRNERARFFV